MDNKGFVSIISLLIMTTILISAIFIMYTSNIGYLIINSSINNIQAYYLSESKIFLALNKEIYYYDQLLPRMETYIKYGRLSPYYDNRIRLDSEDLFEGDKNNIITTRFFYEGNKNFVDLESSSFYKGISKDIIARIIILNELFEIGIPTISKETIDSDQIIYYENYFNCLEQNITIPSPGSDDILGIEVVDYEKINVLKGINNKTTIEFFRNNIENPLKSQILTKDNIFLLIKNKFSEPVNLTIISEDNSHMLLKGIIYIEGNLEVYTDFEFHGILIVNNGNFYIDPSVDVKLEGIIFLKDCIEEFGDNGRIEINYNFDKIIKYGTYLPMFIDPKIQVIKSH